MDKREILNRQGDGEKGRGDKNAGSPLSVLRSLMKDDMAHGQHRQLLSICDNIHQIIYVTDPATCEVLYANRFLRGWLKVDPVGGMCFEEFLGKRRPCEFCRSTRLKTDRAPHDFEFYNPKLKAHLHAVNQMIRWPDGRDVKFHFALDISGHIEMESRLKKVRDSLERRVAKRNRQLERINGDLEVKTRNLEETNTALKVLLNRRGKERAELEQKVSFNAKDRILPYLELLKASGLSAEQEAYVEIMRLNLENIVPPVERVPSPKYLSLTPMEIQVGNLVKLGKTTKEIAAMLTLSPKTAEYHRNSIRKKLGIKNRKVNLRTHLSSCSWAQL